MEADSALNNLDYIVIGIVLLSGLLALMRGLLREVFSIIAWVGAYYASVKYHALALPTVQHYVKNDKAAEWAAIAAVFVIALIALMLVGTAICSFLRGRGLTAIDRSLGFVYGVLRGAVVVCLIYLGATMILWPDIDQPAPPPPAEEVAAIPDQPETDQNTGAEAAPAKVQPVKERNLPPDWLLNAKTRPALGYGAKLLKILIPKEMIDEKIKNTEAEIKAREKAAREGMLNTLSTPALPPPAQAAGQEAPIDVKTLAPGANP
jgi:membrane protein required for colicin V production